ncbi:hypothetical protein C1H46_006101 [Malus baccata]|uniref:BCD1 alpha/beta domain-containing protein n=1 Tax=Malus baccata TaxID=106549 RepID=A0A540NBA5_MALBA|nr:hypothetical protein C1H46_006101 [Malus baccata]
MDNNQLLSGYPFALKSLRSAAASRRTKLLFLPSGMSKREKNQTRYDQRVNENMNLCSLIENHLKPGPWNHHLKLFCEEQLNSLKLFIHKYPKGTRSPFCELDIRVSIRQQLANLVILEYPVIYVFLPSQSLDFEVVKNSPPPFSKPELRTYGRNDLTAGGVTFKEEELEDNIYTKVFDLMKHETSSSPPNISNKRRSDAKKQVFFEDMDFAFDQGLIDEYSGLMAEINLDDFLDLEGEFTKEGVAERNLSSVRRFLLADDDIEEGEILE